MKNDFLQLMSDWQLNLDQLARLAHLPETTLKALFECETAESEQELLPALRPALPLISIYRKLHSHTSDLELHHKWLSTKNSHFGDHTPFEICSQSHEHLAWVAYVLASGVDLQGESTTTHDSSRLSSHHHA